MLAKPLHGWINVAIGDFNERASYLTDIPNDCLDAFIYAINRGSPAVVHFDAEGYDYLLIASYFESYIIIEKEKLEIYQFDINLTDLANELINDIKKHIDEWSDWLSYRNHTKREVRKNKKILMKKITKLEQIL